MAAATGSLITPFLPISGYGSSPGASGFYLDSATDAVAYLVMMPEGATITRARIRFGTKTGTPPTYKISLQAPTSGGGLPSGTPLGGGSPVSKNFTPPNDSTWDGTVREFTFDNSYTAARGELLWVVIDYVSGTIDASNRSQVTVAIQGGWIYSGNFPWYATCDAGTWTKLSGWPNVSVGSESAVYGMVMESYDQVAFGSDHGTANARGLKFTIPSGWCSTYKLRGFHAVICRASDYNNKTWRFSLYDTAANGYALLHRIDVDTDNLSTQTSSGSYVHRFYWDETPVTLTAGSTYYLLFEPQDAGASQYIATYVFDSAADAAASLGGVGNMFQWVTSLNGSHWVEDTNLKVPLFALVLDDITPPEGGTRSPAFRNINRWN